MRHRQQLCARLQDFCRAREGMIATEFALVLPMMVTLYFGVLTFSDGFALKQRVQSLSRTAADLVSRITPPAIGTPPSVNATEITNVAQAAASVLAPYDPAGATITLASGNTNVATVPASVVMPAGSTTATFTLTSKPVAAPANVAVSATYGGSTKSAFLAVN